MPIITIASQKGGSGKTSLATNLAAALTLAGERVLLADADPQRSALTWAGLDERAPAALGADVATPSPASPPMTKAQAAHGTPAEFARAWDAAATSPIEGHPQ